jgi:hypothetical protein
LTQTHDIPNVDDEELFWTQDRYSNSDGSFAFIVDDNAFIGANPLVSSFETVCVTTPTN